MGSVLSDDATPSCPTWSGTHGRSRLQNIESSLEGHSLDCDAKNGGDGYGSHYTDWLTSVLLITSLLFPARQPIDPRSLGGDGLSAVVHLLRYPTQRVGYFTSISPTSLSVCGSRFRPPSSTAPTPPPDRNDSLSSTSRASTQGRLQENCDQSCRSNPRRATTP